LVVILAGVHPTGEHHCLVWHGPSAAAMGLYPHSDPVAGLLQYPGLPSSAICAVQREIALPLLIHAMLQYVPGGFSLEIIVIDIVIHRGFHKLCYRIVGRMGMQPHNITAAGFIQVLRFYRLGYTQCKPILMVRRNLTRGKSMWGFARTRYIVASLLGTWAYIAGASHVHGLWCQ
jgi:hypothetical protein